MRLGIFDSGVGGLTVLSALEAVAPKVDLVFVADTLHLPYGEKTPEEVISYGRDILGFFEKEGLDGVIIACNTASAMALAQLEKETSLPLFGVIGPAVEEILRGREQDVLLLATQGTIKTGAYEAELRKRGANVRLHGVGLPQLVLAIQEGRREEALTIARNAIEMAPSHDAVVLGCTHFPIIAEELSQHLSEGVRLIDPSEEVAREVLLYFGDLDGEGRREFYATSEPKAFSKVAEDFLGREIEARRLRFHK